MMDYIWQHFKNRSFLTVISGNIKLKLADFCFLQNVAYLTKIGS